MKRCRHPSDQRVTVFDADQAPIGWCKRCGALQQWLDIHTIAWRRPTSQHPPSVSAAQWRTLIKLQREAADGMRALARLEAKYGTTKRKPRTRAAGRGKR